MNVFEELMRTKNIIINGDDFALDGEASQGIVQAIDLKFINSVSISVINEPLLQMYSEAICQRTHISLGLHINLTEGSPLSEAAKCSPTFVNRGGSFYDAALLLNREEALEVPIIVQEIMAQINRFLRFIKRPPSHLDSHQHFAYLSTQAFRSLVLVSKLTNIPIRSPKPFISAHSLSSFIARVNNCQGIQLNFDALTRSSQLANIFP